jgi:putative redox protein
LTNQRRVQVNWLGGYRTDVSVRGVHHLQGDETPQYGGEDSGPMPTELLLAAVGTCMCLAIAHVARKRQIRLTRIALDVDADKDMDAFRFRDIFLVARVDLPQEQLDPLLEQAMKYCFVSNTLRFGCNLHYTAESLNDSTAAAPAAAGS